MFIAGDIIFLELQKTGGSHIRRLLKQYLDGKLEGKHNRLLCRSDGKFIIGSIRNPWDWYVSLWAYGVGGKGAIRSRVCKGVDFNYYHRMLPKEMGKNWLTPTELLNSLYHDLTKPIQKWEQTYDNSSDPSLFRAWIKLLLDSERKYDIGEGFGFSPLSQHAGLMTYRYFRLFTIGDKVYSDKSLSAFEKLADFDEKNNIINGMIRTESLEEDFIQVLKDAGLPLSSEQSLEILNKEAGKTNVSKRKSTAFYYDDETTELVRSRDSYIIDKYNYEAPHL